MENESEFPKQYTRENAYYFLDGLIKKEFEKKEFYHKVTKVKYKIDGLATSLNLIDVFLKVTNLDKNKKQNLKISVLNDLEIITAENHP